jgi:hypothetical protein
MSAETSRTSANVEAARGAAKGRPLNTLLWCVQAFLALVFVSAAWAKLTGTPEMVALFVAVGLDSGCGTSRASSSSPEPY